MIKLIILFTLFISNISNAVVKSVVIAGSYSKALPEIKQAIQEFKANKIEILAPIIGKIENEDTDFVLINAEHERGKTPKEIEDEFLAKLKKADIFYVVNKNGYIGLATSMEMGYALALNKPIYCLTTPLDIQHRMYCIVKNIKDISSK